MNRFPALVKTFELLTARPEVQHRNIVLGDWSPIQTFIDRAPSLGNPALKDMIAETNDPVLIHLLAWSEAVNRDIGDMVTGLPPFPFVSESLRKLSGRADTMVVSATPTDALHREWIEHGIDSYVSIIAGQEYGKKEDQLKLTIKDKYPNDHVLLVGDAMGDLTAARSAGAMFYPIVPGEEDRSWKIFHDEIIEIFLHESYTKEIEQRYVMEFEKALPTVARWQH
jgi:phosphoglycolate phosphatase-like HAD superfamily hydrolase